MRHLSFFTLLFLLLGLALQAQQTVRGRVFDTQTLAPLEGATVVLLDHEPAIGDYTDAQGEFRLKQVPVGRQAIQVRYLGYAPAVRNNLIVFAGKEVILEIGLEEQVSTAETVVIEAEADKARPLNELASVSARTFSVEEALRYAGSRNDPARMAQNFAGVSGVSDSRNDIIIRGNSPAGVLWRLEGIDVPNPNHFGALGTTGGPVSMLNNNNLSDADFITSAFPAEYGNALAGVFDLNLRNGNNERHEFLGQIGFNGFELGAEGPLGGNNASYIANYRYSTLGVFSALGIDFGTGAAIPEYQDLTFKVNLPTSKAGTFTLFGLGGQSAISFLDSESEEDGFFSGESQDLYNRAAMGMAGFTHTYLFGEKTYGKAMLAISGTRSATDIDSLSVETGDPVRFYAEAYNQLKYTASYQLNHKFSARDHLRSGFILDLIEANLLDSIRTEDNSFRNLRDFSGSTSLLRAYSQWQHKFTDALTLNAGLHYQHFFLNGSQALEPRLGLQYQLAERHTLSLGGGLHSQIQPIQVYFIETQLPMGRTALTNEQLDMTRSWQGVVAYDWLMGNDWRLKAEAYYQALRAAPVEEKESPFSLLNAGADFAFPAVDSLVSEGTGYNYGLELTVEKFFSQGYYVLFTGSLFDSRYRGSDEVLRNTAFNGRYIANLLGGYEFELGRNTLSIDMKATVAGNRHYTPIDLEASRELGATVFLQDQAFSEQYPLFFRLDLKATFRLNAKRLTQEWSVDLQNLTNRDNVFNQSFSRASGEIETTYQLGLFPVVQWRILF